MNKIHWIILTLLLSGCTALQTPKAINNHLYLFEYKENLLSIPGKRKLTLAIGMPSAAAGFDTPQMAYQQRPLELDYFATHRWAETPARMLRPLLMRSLEPVFQSVVPVAGNMPADLRLDTEILRLQQNFTTKPARIELALRAQLTDLKSKRVIAVKLFNETEQTVSEDAYGGVIATNRALGRLLDQLTEFCNNASP
jgi:cholesterol transport system auxiliary component